MLLARDKTWWGPSGLWLAPACMMLMAVVFAGGCVADAPGDGSLPALRQIRSKPSTADLPDLTAIDAGSRSIASVIRIALPLRTSLNDVWSQVDEQVVPALARGVWQANGLRIGVIKRSDVGSLFAALPASYGQNVSRVVATENLVPICASPRLGKAVTVDLTIPPWSVRELHVRRGKLQLLLRVASSLQETTAPPDEDAAARQRLLWELVPHHSLAKFSLLPRSVMEKQLDGQIFDDLAMQVLLSDDQIIVLGLYWPWPTVPTDSEDTSSGNPPTENQASSVDQAATSGVVASGVVTSGVVEPIDDPADLPQVPTAPPLLNHIGRSLFTSLRMGQPVQTIMLLWLEPTPQDNVP